jgi:hypothetical protein
MPRLEDRGDQSLVRLSEPKQRLVAKAKAGSS